MDPCPSSRARMSHGLVVGRHLDTVKTPGSKPGGTWLFYLPPLSSAYTCTYLEGCWLGRAPGLHTNTFIKGAGPSSFDNLPEWSKGEHLRCSIARCVGSNPTVGNFFFVMRRAREAPRRKPERRTHALLGTPSGLPPASEVPQ